jgi:hypothetical protein
MTDNKCGINQSNQPLFCALTCLRILKDFPEDGSYVHDCGWTISFDNHRDKNELTFKVRGLLDRAQTAFCKYGIGLDEQMKELALIYKSNQYRTHGR